MRISQNFLASTAAAALVGLTSAATPAAAADFRALNGIYNAVGNAGATLLVEGVPYNDVDALSLVLNGAEMSAVRARGAATDSPYDFDDGKGCRVSFTPAGKGRNKTITVNIPAGSPCGPANGLNLTFTRQ